MRRRATAGTITPMRTCARSGCSSPAAAILTYDREALIAYLYDVDDPSKRAPGDLCERHAARLVVPRDWTLDNRRAGATAAPEPAPAPRAPKLRAVPSKAPRASSAKRATPRGKAHRKWVDADASLFDPTATDTAEPDVEPSEEPAEAEARYMPRFGPESELGELDAKTPLLRRAFGGV
jgi:hypothetical protein